MISDFDTLFSVKGKVALVTGGSSGIGFMIAEGLLRGGAKVYTCARGAAALDEAKAALGPLGELHTFLGDVGSTAGCEAIRDEIASRESELNILVNNVGALASAPFEEHSREEFRRVIDINLAAAFDLTRVLLPLLKSGAKDKVERANVINISSIAGTKLLQGLNNFAYAASKGGLAMLTRHLGAELNPYNINVNAVAPGLFESKLASPMFDPAHPRYQSRPNVPIDRPGTAEDIAGAVLYLCSRAGAFVTGAVIPVGGGQSTIDWGR